jgi:hypothetical protein
MTAARHAFKYEIRCIPPRCNGALLLCDDQAVPVPPKIFDLLPAFVENSVGWLPKTN